MTTTTKDFVKKTLQEALSGNDDFTSVDLLREFRRQSELLYETERIRELFISDPFEHWNDNPKIKCLGERLQVVDVHRVVTLSGYSFIDAVVEMMMIPCEERQLRPLQLSFRYEKRAETVDSRIEPGIDPPTVWYSIDVSNGVEPLETLLWVQVWADGHRRAEHLSAVNLEETDEDWEDIDDEVDVKQEQKRQRVDEEHSKENELTKDTTERGDRYVAGIDPEVLERLVQWMDLGSDVSDVTVFFLLMTFPFFEHEWDLIGYLLESVFGAESDADEEKDGPKD